MASIPTEEKLKLAAFMKFLTPILYHDFPEEVKKSALSIPWDTVPMDSLRMGVNDTLEQLQDLEGEGLEALDSLLSARDLPTLSFLRDGRNRRVLTLLSRRRLEKEEDAFLIKGILDGGERELFTAEQRSKMETLLGEYCADR